MNRGGQRVWIVGPDFFDTVPAVARAFERLGWETKCYAYDFVRYSPARLFLWRVARRLELCLDVRLSPSLEMLWYNAFLRENVIRGVLAEPPDLLVFFRTFRLNAETRQALVTLGRPILTWATDSLSRYGRCAGIWDIAIRNYVFDGADLQESCRWLPLGYNDEVFRPGDKRDLDILFVGSISSNSYQRRRGFFEILVASDLPARRRVAQVGWGLHLFPALSREFETKGGLSLGLLTAADLGRAIGRAKIAVSIHQDDGQQPVNPMFFAIPGCRTCLVADRREYLGKWLRPEQEFIAVMPENFIQRIGGLLENDAARMEVAEHGFRAAARHTWVERVRTVLEELMLPCR